MRFLFGPQGQLLERLARPPIRTTEPRAAHPADDPRTATELFAAVEEVTRDGGVATEAERAGRFYGVRRVGADGSFDFEEHHYMLSCRCRVINNTIVQWCPAHAAYYARVAPESYAAPDRGEMAARWEGVDESS